MDVIGKMSTYYIIKNTPAKRTLPGKCELWLQHLQYKGYNI
jgi:hypothetical protein